MEMIYIPAWLRDGQRMGDVVEQSIHCTTNGRNRKKDRLARGSQKIRCIGSCLRLTNEDTTIRKGSNRTNGTKKNKKKRNQIRTAWKERGNIPGMRDDKETER